MSPLISRIEELRKELEEYFESTEDDYYHYSNFNLSLHAKRFIESVKRLKNNELSKLVSQIDIETKEGFNNLEADLACVFDLIDDILYEQNDQLSVNINAKIKNQLTSLIIDTLYQESANILPSICSGYGLEDGTVDEAFKSKRNYISSRISFYDSKSIWKLSKQLEGKSDELDKLILSIENGDHLKVEAKFENIQQRIIEEIDNAEFLIWIAVAWFTDKDIARRLYLKQKDGLDIKIIVNDDEINNRVEDIFHKYFKIYKLSPTNKYNNLMHHKFCIIDLKKVIHGSYNWSVKAQYNKETISIVENRSTAEKFAKEFISIKSNFQKK